MKHKINSEPTLLGRKLSIIGDELDQELMNIKMVNMESCLQQRVINEFSVILINQSYEQELNQFDILPEKFVLFSVFLFYTERVNIQSNELVKNNSTKLIREIHQKLNVLIFTTIHHLKLHIHSSSMVKEFQDIS
ncbi:unnamed protein product [Schistosoma curassoni]|uniref:Uncharacterized protein n=1 Tax=Schistosoma curassoni TaxID=6186 RepID=A0A183K2W1_9TREM|nr:unnamed protein product [Schistosoma curassoni]